MLRTAPRLKITLLTVYREDLYDLEALRGGVNGCVLTTQATVDHVRAIREVLRGARDAPR